MTNYSNQFLNELYESLKQTEDCPIDYACLNGYIDVVKWLHFNTDEKCTEYAMINAAANNELEIVKFLYENMKENCSIVEAIECADESDCIEVVKFLYKHIKEHDIDNVREFLYSSYNTEIIKFLNETK